ncbi:2-phospho-L-lactate guanylyltransferase [Subtercola boreus]|uniref:Phosphoenolpyruvate guanylyltransferase n=1 Tax=Subtercola boreus TaxID=120213 RepID=A0A3E0VG88_9MICO|nr:2-phospho-L-lactate guanylyltransferase [Subtercola boreus]RFA08655.1 2-phospho-L-lactate guanylyltransferase [Subtercola boreus]TQL54399.1 2-phospho-L-lactate guanylyltransferase [Subtercola boreus]
MQWSVVVPVKGTDLSKSRLAELPATVLVRRRLALAFALDAVGALSASALVGEIIVVTSDPESAAALAELGARILADPGEGLNVAIATGLTEARRRHPGAPVAAITADLPSLTTADVDSALRAAAEHPAAFVADFEGVGTTTITARPGVSLVPQFGIGSAAAHAAAGLVPLEVPLTSTLRRDVDTPSDLSSVDATAGEHTRRALRAEGPTAADAG